ncbi:putative baseplate component [Pseudomonas phage vB_PsyM_KIL3b]|uniref:Putative baseplate component n=3 Tax=Pseudomonas phage vB_PsyM_KIL1 TaxID=1777065 RepID=A0A142IE26_9CAUD|nr:putative baseplate component [Pseudomonas phage vB_PsyM_KIL2]AMR57643.1 putative baseplate component [Pseudomonas phage vB_PsyM_KIL3]AMR58141.1 putative baseplate component [Pseudomonas phage vB_PsyM_KIL3b]
MAGLSRQGLEIKTLDDVLTDYKTNAASIFSDLVPAGDKVDVTDNSALGRMIGVIAPAEADLWEAIQQVFDSFNPTTAIGIALDNVIALSGITRLPAQSTRAQVILEGDLNTIISSPQGKAYSSTTQRVFSILNPVTLNLMKASGIGVYPSTVAANTDYKFSYSTDSVNFITVTYTTPASGVTANTIMNGLQQKVQDSLSSTFTTYQSNGRLYIKRTDPFQIADYSVSLNLQVQKVQKLGIAVDDVAGVFPQKALAIDTISVPISGWDSISNPVSATTGRLTEKDEELRERFRNSKFVQSQNILEGILDAILNVDGVTDAVVYENDTAVVDINGLPGHSFLPIVLGGLPSDVADAIWQNKPTGIPSIGNTTVQVADSQGILHNISYQQPAKIPVYINMSISDLGSMPGDAAAQIKQNLANYSTSNLFISDDVIYSRLYTPINSVGGFAVNSLTIGTAPNPTGMSNIPIAFNQYASISPENVTVTLV